MADETIEIFQRFVAVFTDFGKPGLVNGPC
jgi:hypothetical protein